MIEVFHLVADHRRISDAPQAQAMHFQISVVSDKTAIADVLQREEYWKPLGLSYQKVAEVEGDDFEHAFTLTNHIEQSWLENAGVKAFGDRHRSTSVGDLMRVDAGNYQLVASFGFESLGQMAETAEPVRERNVERVG